VVGDEDGLLGQVKADDVLVVVENEHVVHLVVCEGAWAIPFKRDVHSRRCKPLAHEDCRESRDERGWRMDMGRKSITEKGAKGAFGDANASLTPATGKGERDEDEGEEDKELGSIDHGAADDPGDGVSKRDERAGP
jgi:hypothetical protein